MTFTSLTSRTCQVAVLLALMLPVAPLASAQQAVSTSIPTRVRTFTLRCQATVPAPPAGTKVLDFWLPIPHDDLSQTIARLEINSPVPYEIKQGQFGNTMLHLHLAPAPATPLVVGFTARVTRTEHLNPAVLAPAANAPKEEADPDQARWLAPDHLVPLDPTIRQQAQDVVSQAGARTDLEKARAIYQHVVGTMTYDKSGQGWGRGDIYYACDVRRGNCTDFHALFIGYCRALGIPARFSIGLPLPAGRGRGEVKGYHCWAEFYTPQTGWVPIDASEAAKDPTRRDYFFGAHDENRVEFTRGRDLVLTPAQAGPPLNYFVFPYAEADGKELPGVERVYEFEDK